MNYHIATNIWGHGRALSPDNGWAVVAYEDEAKRNTVYGNLSYEQTGCILPTELEVCTILGSDDWILIEKNQGEYVCMVRQLGGE